MGYEYCVSMVCIDQVGLIFLIKLIVYLLFFLFVYLLLSLFYKFFGKNKGTGTPSASQKGKEEVRQHRLPDRSFEPYDPYDPKNNPPERGPISTAIGDLVELIKGLGRGNTTRFAMAGDGFKLPSFQFPELHLPSVTMPAMTQQNLGIGLFFGSLLWAALGLFYLGISPHDLFWCVVGITAGTITWMGRWRETLKILGKALGKLARSLLAWYLKKLQAGGKTTPFTLFCSSIGMFILMRFMYEQQYDPKWEELSQWCIWAGMITFMWFLFAGGKQFVGKKPTS